MAKEEFRTATIVEIGAEFEEMASTILELEGYEVVDWVSKRIWYSPCDMVVEKDGKRSFMEIRGRRKEGFFIFNKNKIRRLRELGEDVLVMLIRPDGYKILRLEELEHEKAVCITSVKWKPSKSRLIRLSSFVKKQLDALKNRDKHATYDSLIRYLLAKAGEE